ncbi:periaxin-like [Myripristis murdjan]|uniref:periaxin-like n=1 Tax=Myripristis murdjan TaxID=586833 RepID=UPI0011764936|nr:periaxin-like [Myripristis murdjan]
MSKLKEVHSPESEVIVNTAKDGGAEGLVFSGGGKDGLFIKEVVPESPASKNLSVKEGDQILSATVYFDNVTYEDAIQILEHAQAYKVKLCLKRKPDITESEPGDDMSTPEMREPGKTKRHGDARISWPKFPSFGKGRKSHFKRSHSSSEADEQRKLELSPTTSDTESPIKTQEALKGKKRHKVKLSVLKKRGRVSSSEDQDTDVPTPGPVNGVDVHQTQGPSDLNSPECLDSPSGQTPQVFVTDNLDVMAGSDKHKVELISVDSTLKTTDLTMALADQESPSEPKILDADPAKTETDSGVLGSPSKFKLPSLKIPKLGFSKSKPEDEYVPVDTQYEQNQEMEMAVESQGPGKSPKLTLTSFGEILKSIDVEFDVPTIEEVEEKLSPSKEVCGQDELSVQTKHPQKEDEMTETKSKQKFKFPGLSFSWSPEEAETGDSGHMADTTGGAKQPEKKQTNIKQDPGKSPERAGWLKFPKFGLSSPSEPGKGSKKEDHESEKSPTMDTMDEDVSTTCSIRSSDAFADISSTVTSEQVGLSLSSPTKVTVKYSDPNATMGLGEVHGNVITSTTRTERISVEPNLPEKVTIPSSDVSSSSADTLKLESGKIHVIKSNIQATPEAQHAKLLTDFKVQTAGGLPLKSESKEATSWSTEETYKTQGGKTTFVKRHVVRETSSENRETVVITKQMTHVYGVDPAEPISDETASSIQRLKDSVHTEKMRFFDRAKK